MYKKVLVIAGALGCSLSIFANEFTNLSGPYMGVQFGQNDMHYSDTGYTWPANSVDDKKPAGRIYGGYNFSEFLAAELAYDYFGKPEFTHPTGNTQDFIQQGMDLDGRVNIPFNHGLGLYAKAGLAWVHRGELESRGGFFSDKDSGNKITTLGGAGLFYDFNRKISADISFTRFSSNGDLPKQDFMAIGISYKFNSDNSGAATTSNSINSTESGIPQ